MRLFEYMMPNNGYKEKFKAGDFVEGSLGTDENIVKGVYIAQSGSYHHLIATFKPGTKSTLLWCTPYNVKRIGGEAPPALVAYAMKNPYWNVKPGQQPKKMETNI